ncbi:hypothetical protein NL676_022017 [Syzygium grande]|nr:hypothetical protein NL676_022017 [Syzygium grande]
MNELDLLVGKMPLASSDRRFAIQSMHASRKKEWEQSSPDEDEFKNKRRRRVSLSKGRAKAMEWNRAVSFLHLSKTRS